MADLEAYLRAAKQQGASDEFLVALLHQHGWPEKAVYHALGQLYAESTGQPLPEPQSTLESAREAFYHLLAFGTLATWILAIGSIWFELINTWVPDPTMDYYRTWTIRNVSFQIAAILVSFPVFILATRSILQDMVAAPDKAASGVRRWLTNLALLVAALVFIGDLVSLLATLLQGGLSLRFALKSATVLLLSGGVFLYYTKGLNNSDPLPARNWHRSFALIAGVLICLTLAFGFLKTGSPMVQRLITQDNRRVRDLHLLSQRVNTAYQAMNPKSLPRTPNTGQDPFTKKPYEYTRSEGPQYEICATFDLASQPLPTTAEDRWAHPAGRHCYTLSAEDPMPYPPF